MLCVTSRHGQVIGDDSGSSSSASGKSVRRMFVGQQSISFRRDHMELSRPIKDGLGASLALSTSLSLSLSLVSDARHPLSRIRAHAPAHSFFLLFSRIIS